MPCLTISRKTEIDNFDLIQTCGVIDQYILKFEISMNNKIFVQEMDTLAKLLDIALNLKFMKVLSILEQLHHRIVFTVFKQDVHVFFVFKKVFETNYKWILTFREQLVKLNFLHELLLGSASKKRLLADYFASRNFTCIYISDFIALSKATLA